MLLPVEEEGGAELVADELPGAGAEVLELEPDEDAGEDAFGAPLVLADELLSEDATEDASEAL